MKDISLKTKIQNPPYSLHCSQSAQPTSFPALIYQTFTTSFSLLKFTSTYLTHFAYISFPFRFFSCSSLISTSSDYFPLYNFTIAFYSCMNPSYTISLCVYSDSRIALCGANAAGKSTILKLLAGFLKPTAGEIERTKEAICAVFWQHHQDQLDLNLTPIQTLMQFCPGESEGSYRAHLSSFGITPTMVNQINRTLSGGQKTRLSLSLLTFKTKPRILVLDELTNHIDIETKQALIEALQLYNGAVVVVSHDGPFVSSVTDELYVVDDGKCARFEGEFDDYKSELKRKWKK